ncbi:serine hydrolase domain-containing protein [Oryzobacter telluris]|uniref:serine hydrolase domain-containing protein n=1 Tax=Oryzobacter telluris TaxID=3149179 RepID=UPI00370D7EC8
MDSQIDRFLTTALRESAIPGVAVALTRGDQVLMVGGYGHDSTGAAVTESSLFRVASLSKSFTALAVMQLVDAGLVDLDDSVQQHLPEFQMADPRSAQITVRQLLDQTSGITDAVVPELSRPQPSSPTDATTSLRSARLSSTPGTSWSYANPNYQVAARLVEALSGEEFGHYLRRHIFEPAQMAATTSTVTADQPVPGVAQGHLIAYGHAFPAPGFRSYATGDGGIVSSAADMARWLVVNAHDGRTADGTAVVSSRGLRLLHTPSAPRVGYALGWATRGPTNAPTRIEHSGSLFTFTAQQALWPASGYGVVLLFNSGSPMMLEQTAIVHGVFDIIEGKSPPSSGASPAAKLDAVLAVLTLAALALGTLGVLRAGRWARRRRGSAIRGLRMLPSVLVLAAGTAFPLLAKAWVGRDVTWSAAAYQWPAMVVFVFAVLLATAATVLARSWQWSRIDHAAPSAESPSAATGTPDEERAEQGPDRAETEPRSILNPPRTEARA